MGVGPPFELAPSPKFATMQVETVALRGRAETVAAALGDETRVIARALCALSAHVLSAVRGDAFAHNVQRDLVDEEVGEEVVAEPWRARARTSTRPRSKQREGPRQR